MVEHTGGADGERYTRDEIHAASIRDAYEAAKSDERLWAARAKRNVRLASWFGLTGILAGFAGGLTSGLPFDEPYAVGVLRQVDSVKVELDSAWRDYNALRDIRMPEGVIELPMSELRAENALNSLYVLEDRLRALPEVNAYESRTVNPLPIALLMVGALGIGLSGAFVVSKWRYESRLHDAGDLRLSLERQLPRGGGIESH